MFTQGSAGSFCPLSVAPCLPLSLNIAAAAFSALPSPCLVGRSIQSLTWMEENECKLLMKINLLRFIPAKD